MCTLMNPQFSWAQPEQNAILECISNCNQLMFCLLMILYACLVQALLEKVLQ